MKVIEKVKNFYKKFPLKKCVIGHSVLGQEIYALTVEKTPFPTIIVQYSIHAREYLTAYLSLKQIIHFIKNGRRGTVHFIPLANPDGVLLALSKNPLYKANGQGVDLNVNFNARWGEGAKNVFVPAIENYVGEHPFSAPETRALRDFTLKIMPNATISYHTKGEEIYWYFSQDEKTAERDYKIAKKLSNKTGYPLVLTPNSAGGYKDWCIQELKIPSFTIEVGRDSLSHPLGAERVGEVFRKNKRVIDTLLESIKCN